MYPADDLDIPVEVVLDELGGRPPAAEFEVSYTRAGAVAAPLGTPSAVRAVPAGDRRISVLEGLLAQVHSRRRARR